MGLPGTEEINNRIIRPELAALTEDLVSSQRKRVEASKITVKMTPQQIKEKHIEWRISKRARGERTDDITIAKVQERMKAKATREQRSHLITKGQARLIGSVDRVQK